MFKKTDEVKVLRDPVHGYIHVEYQVIWDVINSSWMQRLRRIRQLGGAYMVYHCADHTRFGHSLGVYEIVRRMVTEIPDIRDYLNDEDRMTVMLAALLHDVGHGPFSHAFESVSKLSHEVYTCRIIEEDTEITKILENEKEGLAKNVADVIRHKHHNHLLSQLISSQLDADRMDYLIRDAYFTGARYGEFDMERIMRTIRVEEEKGLVIKESGVHAVENYIMARYHMYWQVYYHPTARSYEYCIHALFHRLQDVGNIKDKTVLPLFKELILGKEIPLQTYFSLDEESCSYGFQLLTKNNDSIIKDLAQRVLNRRLFEYTEKNPKSLQKIRKKLKKEGYDAKYYLGKDEVSQDPYVPYLGKHIDDAIWVKMKNGEVLELSKASNIVYSLIHGPVSDDQKIFFPSEIMKK